jgi:hypothetical protein
MWRRLRTWVPIFQVLLADSVFAWTKLGSGQVYDYYAHAVRDLVVHLNLPLVAIWIVIFLPFRRFTDSVVNVRGPLATVMYVLFGVALTISVAAFWYFVVTEVEKRARGLSVLRPSNSLGTVISVIVLLCFGAGAVWYAYMASRPLWYVARSGAILTGVLPTIWGCVFFCMAIQDLLSLLKGEGARRGRT